MGRVSDAKERLISAVAELIWIGSYGQTTVDLICRRANVRKGSFYHFFESKADLAVSAIEVEWARQRQELDAIFSPTVPPLQRIVQWARRAHRIQMDLKKQYGHMLGCPLHHLGTEVSSEEGELCELIRSIMRHSLSYFETSIRDARAAGLVHHTDPAAKARMVYAYAEGVLTQARIFNNPDLLKELEPGILGILGAAPLKKPRRTARTR